MFQNHSMNRVYRILSAVLALSLAFPAPGYSTRPAGTAKSPVTLNALEQDLLATLGGVLAGARSEVRQDIRFGLDNKEKAFTNTIGVYDLTGVLAERLPTVPNYALRAIREKLTAAVRSGAIKSFELSDLAGTHIVVHITHNSGELNASAHRLMLEAVRAGLEGLQKRKKLNTDVKKISAQDLTRALRVVATDDSKIEREAESVVVAIGSGVTPGAANIKLFHEFGIPGSTPLKKLGLSKAPGFRFRVKRSKDIFAGKMDGDEWEFEISDDIDDENGNIVREGINQSTQLLALLSQPMDYQITAIYPVETGGLPVTEPVVTVAYQPVFGSDGKPVLTPVIIYRSQSGADAVGGINGILHDVNVVPGGEEGDRYVVTKPATREQARRAPKEGMGYFVTYGYQSRNNGEIPVEGVEDHVGMNRFGYVAEQEDAEKLHKVISTHENDQPYESPARAERRVEHTREKQNRLFRLAPKESETDEFTAAIDTMIEAGDLIQVVDDKADMGGRWGHTKVPEMFIAIYRATLEEAIENGTITDGNTLGFTQEKGRVKDKENVGVGDDGHIITIGNRSQNGLDIHQLSFLAFTRAYLFAVLTGKKYYGIGQDFAGPEAKAAKKNPFFYSQLNERFFELIEEIMPNNERELGVIQKVRQEWEAWKERGTSEVELTEPFSGNVSQQGIGSAIYAFDPKTEKGFDVIAGDKMGPAALNRLIKHMVYKALAAGKFENGLVFEIWDLKAFDETGRIPHEDIPAKFGDIKMLLQAAATPDPKSKKSRISAEDAEWIERVAYSGGELREDLSQEDNRRLEEIIRASGFVPTKRIFLDAEEDREAITRYLADSDRFNVKRVWSKRTRQWDIEDPQSYLERPLLGASVTRLGILAGGEYLGKDDPVIVGHTDLLHYGHEFLRNEPLIVQGDMNGSHWEQVLVTGMKDAVATARSMPIMVGLHYGVSEDGKTLTAVEDIYNSRRYDAIRRRTSRFNRLFNKAQLGQFEPHGTNVRTVEAAYELAKILRKLNSPNSPFLVKNIAQRQEKIRKEIEKLEQMRTANYPEPVQSQLDSREAELKKKLRHLADPAGNHVERLYAEVGTEKALSRSEVRASSKSVDLSGLQIIPVDGTVRTRVLSRSGFKAQEAYILDEDFVARGGLAFVSNVFQGPAVVVSDDPVIRGAVNAYREKVGASAQITAVDSVEKAIAALERLTGGTQGSRTRALLTENSDERVQAALIKELGEAQVEIILQSRFDQMAADAGLTAVVASLVNAILTARSA